jgi:hypothetical protein
LRVCQTKRSQCTLSVQAPLARPGPKLVQASNAARCQQTHDDLGLPRPVACVPQAAYHCCQGRVSMQRCRMLPVIAAATCAAPQNGEGLIKQLTGAREHTAAATASASAVPTCTCMEQPQATASSQEATPDISSGRWSHTPSTCARLLALPGSLLLPACSGV